MKVKVKIKMKCEKVKRKLNQCQLREGECNNQINIT